jgi:hypothetical protein
MVRRINPEFGPHFNRGPSAPGVRRAPGLPHSEGLELRCTVLIISMLIISGA